MHLNKSNLRFLPRWKQIITNINAIKHSVRGDISRELRAESAKLGFYFITLKKIHTNYTLCGRRALFAGRNKMKAFIRRGCEQTVGVN